MNLNVDRECWLNWRPKNCFVEVTFILVGNNHAGYLTPIHSCGLIYSNNNTVKFKMSYNLDKNVGLIGRKNWYNDFCSIGKLYTDYLTPSKELWIKM
jgi:hypothetical protein